MSALAGLEEVRAKSREVLELWSAVIDTVRYTDISLSRNFGNFGFG